MVPGGTDGRTRAPAPARLLVGPDPAELGLLRRSLEAQGIAVVGEASDPGTGRTLTVRLGPDVVLIDRGLLGADGLEQTRALRVARPGIEVVILTAYDEPPTVSAEAVGAYVYLVKGCSPALMRDVIVQACGRAPLATAPPPAVDVP